MKRGCDLLIWIFKKQDQKIAACRSAYKFISVDAESSYNLLLTFP
ncbi:hypothetical protein EMIT0215P_10427 [Pseudomonas serboccidentalis]